MGKSVNKLKLLKRKNQVIHTAQLTNLFEPLTFPSLPTMNQPELLDSYNTGSLALQTNTSLTQSKPKQALIEMDSEDNVIAANRESLIETTANAIKAIRKNSMNFNSQTTADTDHSIMGNLGVVSSFPSADLDRPLGSGSFSFATTTNKEGNIRLFHEPPRPFSGSFMNASPKMLDFGVLSARPAAIEHDAPSSVTKSISESGQGGSQHSLDVGLFSLKPRSDGDKPTTFFSALTSSAAAPAPKPLFSLHDNPVAANSSKIQSILLTDPFAKRWFDGIVKEAANKSAADLIQEAVHKTRMELEKGFVVEREKLNKKHAGQIQALKHSKKTGSQRESVLAYDLMAAYKSRQLDNVQIIGSHKPLTLTAEEAVRLLSEQHQVGEEYRRLCHEALAMYKKALKRQYKDHLDDIETESREWLRIHATGLTGDELEAYFMKIFEAQLYDPDLPTVGTNVVETLKPDSADCETMIGAGLQRVNGNFKALCGLNESLSAKYERDTNPYMQRRKPSARPSIMEPAFKPLEKNAPAENVPEDRVSAPTVSVHFGPTVQEMMAATKAYAARFEPTSSNGATKLPSHQTLGIINNEHYRTTSAAAFAGPSSTIMNAAAVETYQGNANYTKRLREGNGEGSSEDEGGLRKKGRFF